MKKRSNIAPIAIFFATMLVIHFLSSLIFNLFPFPIKPTIVHIPVIIASIILRSTSWGTLGFLMGLLSLTVNTITILPTSYLFSPLRTKWKHLLSYHCHCPTYFDWFNSLLSL